MYEICGFIFIVQSKSLHLHGEIKIVISSLQLDISSMNETLKVLKTIHVQQNS